MHGHDREKSTQHGKIEGKSHNRLQYMHTVHYVDKARSILSSVGINPKNTHNIQRILILYDSAANDQSTTRAYPTYIMRWQTFK